MKFLYLIFIFFVYGTDEPYSEVEPSVNENSFISLLSITKDQCYENLESPQCERILIYEKDTEEIHHLLVDSREDGTATYTVNDALKDPSTFTGPMETFKVSTIFSFEGSVISVLARFEEKPSVHLDATFLGADGVEYDQEKKITISNLYRTPPE